MKIAMLVLPLFYLAGNGYLFWKVWQIISGVPIWGRVVISLLFWVAAFSIFISIGLRESRVPDMLLRWFFRIGAVWMVFMLYMVMSLIVFDIVGLFVPVLRQSLLFALPITISILVYGYFNYKHPKMEHISIDIEKSHEGGPMRIVVISDIHLGYGTTLTDLRGYVKLINAQHPDLVLIAGDLIDNSVKPLLCEPFADALAMINAPMGIYMVPGNHEYISGMDASADFLSRTPITLLSDRVVSLPNGVQIVGRDDRINRRRMPLDNLIDSVDMSRPVILLDHQPYELAEADSLGVDIQISGHTHHGQIFPLNLITDRLFEQSHGYRKWGNSHIIVTSGLSLWGPPFRIGTDSEMVVVELK